MINLEKRRAKRLRKQSIYKIVEAVACTIALSMAFTAILVSALLIATNT